MLRDGCSMQSGAGGTSLAVGIYMEQKLRERGQKARFAFGGSTKYMVQMLENGSLDYILDAQAFDLEAVRSARENSNHIDLSVFQAYNYQ